MAANDVGYVLDDEAAISIIRQCAHDLEQVSQFADPLFIEFLHPWYFDLLTAASSAVKVE